MSNITEARGFASTFRRFWWVVVVSILVGVGLAVAITAGESPKYQSSVTFFVSTPAVQGNNAFDADQYAQQRVNSYAPLLRSDRLARLIVAQPGLGNLSIVNVRSEIVAAADPQTVLLTATVTDASKARSLRIATAISTQFGPMVAQLDNRGSAKTANVVLNVVSGPRASAAPVSPRKKENYGIGLLVGLFFGLALAVVLDRSDNSVREPDGLAAASGVPLLATISFERSAKQTPLLISDEAHSVRGEQTRRLRTNLQFIGATRSIQVVCMVSAGPSEGKTSTTINLALMLAESGRRVLIIDADLRKPSVATQLGLAGEVGLTGVLAGETLVTPVLQFWGAGHLKVLPSGLIPPNPSELLGSCQMKSLVDSMRSEFDFIIIDTPPVLVVTDAALVGAVSDGALLVVRSGKTSKSQVRSTIETLHAAGVTVLGSVLTMSQVSREEKRGYKYASSAEVASIKRTRT